MNNRTSLLDQIRLKQGMENLKNHFENLVKLNMNKAIKLINDTNLQYPSLYILQNTIAQNNLNKEINSRNKVALDLTNSILNRRKNDNYKKLLSTRKFPKVYFVMRWILDTGYRDDGLDNQYDDVLDTIAVILIKVYNDKASLPIISDMLFSRNRRNALIHDLLWALYESKSLESLILIAQGLKSKNNKDFILARNLLSFIPGVKFNKNGDDAYNYFIKWFNENKSFLKYTGESFQSSSKPEPYKIINQAKYLCKPVSINNGEFLDALTANDNTLINEFNNLDSNNRRILSSFSYNLYNKNITMWHKWINDSISSQLSMAKKVGGVKS